VKIVGLHFNPKPSVTVQRFKFNSRLKQPGETVTAFVAELKIIQHCEFGDGDTLNAMLRDCLFCGISDVRMQRRLLTESDLTFDKALQLALAVDSAERSRRT